MTVKWAAVTACMQQHRMSGSHVWRANVNEIEMYSIHNKIKMQKKDEFRIKIIE